jgi:diguanylate cyclase (GGDEF)-like protein/PAS domain S-box-containing protein
MTHTELQTQLEEALKEIAHYKRLSKEGGNIRLRETEELSRLIAKLKETEKALKESEGKFRAISASAHDAIIMMDDDGIITYCNEAAERIFDYTSNEFIGKELHAFLAPQKYYQSFLKELDHFKKTGEGNAVGKTLELSALRRNGSEFPIELSLSSVHMQNRWFAIGILRDITIRKQMEEQLQTMSLTDELTGLYNRRGFFTLAGQQMKVAERTKKNMLLFFADLDKMKHINDTLGHQEGDKALIDIATVLKEAFRESDIIGRMGGDEFAILAIDTADETEEVLIKRLHAILDAYSKPDGKYQLSLSVGIAHYDPETPSTLDELMAQADTLMYDEKRKKQG